MYKQRYQFKLFITAIAIIALPQIGFLLLVGLSSPPKGPWNWFVLIATECAAWVGFLAIIAQLSGSGLGQWLGWDKLRILNAFEKTTRRTLNSIRDTLPGLDHRVERNEVDEVWQHLLQRHPVLIDGESGSGKSGIAAQVVRQADRQKPTLFLNARNYSAIVSNFNDLEQYIGINLPIRDCLEKLAKTIGGCLLVIDQLDSVIGSPAYQVSTELLASARTLEKVEVVAVGSTLNSVEYQPIKELEFNIVRSRSLDRQNVTELLGEMKVTSPSNVLVALSGNLFYLSMVAEVAGETDVSQVNGKVTLLERYKAILENTEEADVIQTAIDVAYENLEAGRVDIQLPRIQGNTLKRLQRRGLIIQAAHGLFRFRHEQLIYYFYAVGAVDRAIEPATIIERIAGHHATSALVWILRLYLQRQAYELEEFLRIALLRTDRLVFYEQAALLDEILSWPDFTENHAGVAVVLEMLRAESRKDLRTYLFVNKPRPEWASILWDNGFFEILPSPEQIDGKYFLGHWDVQQYLTSVATQVPDIVIKHIETLEGHAWYISRAIYAACRISPDHSWRVAPKIVRWLEDPQIAHVICDQVSVLMWTLIKGDQIDSALQLFESLTCPQLIPSADPGGGMVFDEMLSTRIIYPVFGTKQQPATGFEPLQRRSPYAVIAILEKHLLSFLKQETEAKHQPEYEISSWWRRAIEDTDQDSLDTYEDQILRALRNTIEIVVHADAIVAKQLVSRYLSDQRSIFHRLAIHILHRFPQLYSAFVSRELLKAENLGDVNIHHEYFLLLQRGFPLLSLSDQELCVGLILDGPNEERTKKLAEWAHRERGAEYEAYASNYRKRWIRDRLWMIKENLDDHHKQVLSDLISEVGEPDHPSFLSWSSGGFFQIQDVSPFPVDQLSQRSADELFELLNAWQPSPNEQFGPQRVSYSGLAGQVADAITADPERYRSRLGDIASLRPEYASAIIGRWANTEHTVLVPWTIAIALSESLLMNPNVLDDIISATHDESWTDVRRSIARLLKMGVTNDQRLIPPDLLPRTRELLIRLANDPDPNLIQDRPPEGWMGHLDPITIALNHVRPLAISSLMSYAVHRANSASQPLMQSSNNDGYDRLEASVRDVFDKKLNKDIEPSWAVHSLFGEYLPTLYWLDKDWVESNIHRIFPEGEDEESIWFFVAAWEAFTFNKYHTYLIELLRPYYKLAIRNVSLGYVSRSHLQSTQSLAMHVVCEYLLVDYNLSSAVGQKSLIVEFLDNTQPDIRKDIPWALWRALQDNPDYLDRFWSRARVVWEWRVDEAAKSNHSPDFDAEMEEFAHLTLVVPDTESLSTLQPLLEGLLPHIGHSKYRSFGWDSIEKFLAHQVEHDAVSTIRFYRLMYDQRSSPPHWMHHTPEARKIIETAAANPDSREEALSLINLLARWGDHEFRDVYDRYSM